MPPDPNLSCRARAAHFDAAGNLNRVLLLDGERAAIEHARGMLAGVSEWLALQDPLFAVTLLSTEQARALKKKGQNDG